MKLGLFVLAALMFGYGVFGLFAPDQWVLIDSKPHSWIFDLVGFLSFAAGAVGLIGEFLSNPGSSCARILYVVSFAAIFLWIATGNANTLLYTSFFGTCWITFVFTAQIGSGLNLMLVTASAKAPQPLPA